MQSLSAAHLLTLWEAGLDQSFLHRGLALLAAAYPESPPDTLATLPIGQRDARLFALRAHTFGHRLNSLAACPACGERLELTFDVNDIADVNDVADINDIAPPELPGLRLDSVPSTETYTLALDDYAITFRLPNSFDLVAISHLGPEDNPQHQLLARCILDSTHKGKPCPAERFPEKVAQALTSQMAEADPQAEVQLDLICPACRHSWQAAFDILPYFWAEIHAWAQRILREIHLLASAYGWSEYDILALNPRRRAMYLQMVMQ